MEKKKTLQIDKKVFLLLFMFDHKKHTCYQGATTL